MRALPALVSALVVLGTLVHDALLGQDAQRRPLADGRGYVVTDDDFEIDLTYGFAPEDRTRVGGLSGVVVEVYGLGANGSDVRRFKPFDNDPSWDRRTLELKRSDFEGSTSLRRGWEPAKVFSPDGAPLEGKARQRIVNRLLGVYDEMPPLFDPTAVAERTRAYVPGLWNHGTTPGFVGPKTWGKTTLLTQLPAALIIPGRRLFGYFEPVQMTERERERDVWMINPETRPAAVHEGLLVAGLVPGYRDGSPCYHAPIPDWQDYGVLIVEHLRGRSTDFDLTNEGKLDWWEDRLVEYTNRRMPPLTLIVDAITAILGNDTSRYGAFAAALMALQASAEIPNGLGVMHSPMGAKVDTPMNGVESMAHWDGLWLASADRFPPEPATPRYFRTVPRLGDPDVPRRRLVVGDDNLLRLIGLENREPHEAAPVSEVSDRRGPMRGRLQEAGETWTWTKSICGTGDEFKANKQVLEDMERDGEVVSRSHREGRARGYQWRLTEFNRDSDDA